MACDADVVIGADGIHSIVKREIGLTARPTSEGIVAYRGLVPAEKLSWASELRGLNMWMGDGRSFICFPVSEGRLDQCRRIRPEHARYGGDLVRAGRRQGAGK